MRKKVITSSPNENPHQFPPLEMVSVESWLAGIGWSFRDQTPVGWLLLGDTGPLAHLAKQSKQILVRNPANFPVSLALALSSVRDRQFQGDSEVVSLPHACRQKTLSQTKSIWLKAWDVRQRVVIHYGRSIWLKITKGHPRMFWTEWFWGGT